MPCANCGSPRTIKAHLIPQAFIREVRVEDKGHALTDRVIGEFQPSQNGRYDDAILCAECDNRLGADEKYAFETLKRIREAAPRIVGHPFSVQGVDGDRLLRFAMGIVWKYALTRPHYGRISIGPYADRLKGALFAAGDPQIDAFMMKLHSGDDVSYFYRAPLTSRYQGVNFARFSVGGFVFLVKLDQRTAAQIPAEGWLRGNRDVLIPALALDNLEEGRIFLGARKSNPRLDAYLEKVSLNPTLQ